MTAEQVQELIDRLGATSGQRWALASSAVAVAVLASGTAALGSGPAAVLVVVLVGGLAVTAAVRPDSSTGLSVVGIVVWQWLVAVDDVTTARAPVVALCLFAFHALVALMAVTPFTAVVHPAVLRRWLRRAGLVSLATVAVWALVVVFQRRGAEGDALVTLAAFAVVVAAILALRALTFGPGGRSQREPDATGR